MKLLNKVKQVVTDGKKGKKEVLRAKVKMADSAADYYLLESETDLKRTINLTGIEELTPLGDKITKTKVLTIWEDVTPKKKEVKTEKEETK